MQYYITSEAWGVWVTQVSKSSQLAYMVFYLNDKNLTQGSCLISANNWQQVVHNEKLNFNNILRLLKYGSIFWIILISCENPQSPKIIGGE